MNEAKRSEARPDRPNAEQVCARLEYLRAAAARRFKAYSRRGEFIAPRVRVPLAGGRTL